MKQTCEYIGRLHLLKDCELEEGEQRQLLNHLRECDVCQSEWMALNRLSRMIGSIGDVSPRPGFDKAFLAKVDACKRKRPARMLTWLFLNPLRCVMVSAASVLILGAGLYMGMNAVRPCPDEMTLLDQIDLLEDYDVVENLDLLENWDAINRVNVET